MYWYEKENGALLQCEKDGFIQFMREYNNREMKMSFLFDEQRRFCVNLLLPVKMSPEEPWRYFKFHVVYMHDHPGRGADGLYGGSIRVYPMTKLKPGFHHLVTDSAMGIPYICQTKTANSWEVNGYNAMRRVLRWIDVYCVWEKTGVDLDRQILGG